MSVAHSTTTVVRVPACRPSEAVTRGFRVSVEPAYIADQSDPENRKYLFSYRIRISNEGPAPAQLVARRWLVIDSAGRERTVEGEGVIGQQPLIRPGQSHEYSSYCDLQTAWGTMEGQFVMRGPAGETFPIQIARFFLVAGGPGHVPMNG